MFTVMPDDFGSQAHVEVASFPGGSRRIVIENAADARYISTGHLVFLRQGCLMAAAFDPERLQPLGPEVLVVPIGDG